ncbi:hypothetical protein [Sphingomonas sp. MS122]
MVAALLATDLARFRGAYTVEAWRLARSEMQAIRDFADEHTRLMPHD